MQTSKQPYELLVRWGSDGRLSGVHVQFRFVTTTEDGKPIGEFIGPPEPVGTAGRSGFPLSEILSDLTVAALAERDALAARLATLQQDTGHGDVPGTISIPE